MTAPRLWKLVPALLACCAFGLAYGKLPAPSDEQKAKAAEAKAKAEEAAKKDAEALGKSQDRAADNFKRGKTVKTSTTAPVKKP